MNLDDIVNEAMLELLKEKNSKGSDLATLMLKTVPQGTPNDIVLNALCKLVAFGICNRNTIEEAKLLNDLFFLQTISLIDETYRIRGDCEDNPTGSALP